MASLNENYTDLNELMDTNNYTLLMKECPYFTVQDEQNYINQN